MIILVLLAAVGLMAIVSLGSMNGTVQTCTPTASCASRKMATVRNALTDECARPCSGLRNFNSRQPDGGRPGDRGPTKRHFDTVAAYEPPRSRLRAAAGRDLGIKAYPPIAARAGSEAARRGNADQTATSSNRCADTAYGKVEQVAFNLATTPKRSSEMTATRRARTARRRPDPCSSPSPPS